MLDGFRDAPVTEGLESPMAVRFAPPPDRVGPDGMLHAGSGVGANINRPDRGQLPARARRVALRLP